MKRNQKFTLKLKPIALLCSFFHFNLCVLGFQLGRHGSEENGLRTSGGMSEDAHDKSVVISKSNEIDDTGLRTSIATSAGTTIGDAKIIKSLFGSWESALQPSKIDSLISSEMKTSDRVRTAQALWARSAAGGFDAHEKLLCETYTSRSRRLEKTVPEIQDQLEEEWRRDWRYTAGRFRSEGIWKSFKRNKELELISHEMKHSNRVIRAWVSLVEATEKMIEARRFLHRIAMASFHNGALLSIKGSTPRIYSRTGVQKNEINKIDDVAITMPGPPHFDFTYPSFTQVEHVIQRREQIKQLHDEIFAISQDSKRNHFVQNTEHLWKQHHNQVIEYQDELLSVAHKSYRKRMEQTTAEAQGELDLIWLQELKYRKTRSKRVPFFDWKSYQQQKDIKVIFQETRYNEEVVQKWNIVVSAEKMESLQNKAQESNFGVLMAPHPQKGSSFWSIVLDTGYNLFQEHLM